MRNRFAVAVVFLILLAAPGAFAQTHLPIVPAGTRVELNGSYSLLRNEDNEQGYTFSAAVRLTPHWGARFSRIAYNGAPGNVQFLVGQAEYRFSGAFLSRTEQVDASRLEFFVHAGAGAVRQTIDGVTAANAAFIAGGGVDFRVDERMAIRIATVDYVRGRILGENGAERNRAVLTSGINLRF